MLRHCVGKRQLFLAETPEVDGVVTPRVEHFRRDTFTFSFATIAFAQRSVWQPTIGRA